MIKVIVCGIFVLRMHFAYSQFVDETIPGSLITCGSSNQGSSDPVSTFLSGLGDLIVGIDNEFSRQLAPKVNTKDEVKDHMYGTPRASYFNRIRENYRNVQKRLGELLGMLDPRTSSDMGSVSVQNKEPESEIGVPLSSLKLAISSNEGLEKSHNDKIDERNIEPGQTLPSYTRNFKLGNTEINMNSNLGPLQTSELLKNAENQIKKFLGDQRVPNGNIDDHQAEDNMQEKKLHDRHNLQSELNLDIKEISPTSAGDFQTSEPSQIDDSNPEDQIPEDVLYSEDAFDTLTKRRGFRFRIRPRPRRIFSIKFEINFKIG